MRSDILKCDTIVPHTPIIPMGTELDLTGDKEKAESLEEPTPITYPQGARSLG